jgi:hypothetical protein
MNAALAAAVAMFRAQCMDAAERYAAGEVPLLDGVDALQERAIAHALVGDIGQDAVQTIMAEAFKRVR